MIRNGLTRATLRGLGLRTVEPSPRTVAGLRQVIAGALLSPEQIPRHIAAPLISGDCLTMRSSRDRFAASLVAVSCTTPLGRCAPRLNSGVRCATKFCSQKHSQSGIASTLSFSARRNSCGLIRQNSVRELSAFRAKLLRIKNLRSAGFAQRIAVVIGRAVQRSCYIRNDCGSLGAISWCAAVRERRGASN